MQYQTIDLLERIATIIALVIGGSWAYFKFVKGRFTRARLETAINGRFVDYPNFSGFVFRITLKNVGFTKIMIDRNKSTVEVLIYPKKNYLPQFHNAFVERIGVVDAIRMHDCIEPGECITEERLIALPKGRPIAVIPILRLLEARPALRWRRTPVLWCSMAVITHQ